MNFFKKITLHGFTQAKPIEKASAALFLLLAAFILLTFKQYGISNDEMVQHTYGQLLLKFYASGLHDLSAFEYKNLYLYGGFFDLLAAGLEKILPLWVWDLRHLLSALFGYAGIVAVYRSTLLLANHRAAFISALLLAITGAWTGAMFTHTKDVTFGACMAWAMYYTLLLAKDLRHIPLSLSIKLGIAIGAALGLRIGGVFAIIYLVLLLAIALVKQDNLQQRWQILSAAVLGLLPAAIVSLLMMIAFWPWVAMGADHLLIAAKSFSHFAFNMNTIVDGSWVSIGNVPRSYLLDYLAIRLPEIFLLGLLLAFLFAGQTLYKWLLSRVEISLTLAMWSLLIAALFPILFVLWDRPALYNGVRHFTFILPPLAVLAGIALNHAWSQSLAYPRLQKSYLLVFILSVCYTICIMVQLHPYEYVYYNRVAGDFKSAQHAWESDYWSSSLLDATSQLEDFVTQEQGHSQPLTTGPYYVAICAEAFQGRAYLDHRFAVTENWIRADFFISSTNMNCDKVLQGNIIGKVERLGATLAVIKDRRDLVGDQRIPKPAPNN